MKFSFGISNLVLPAATFVATFLPTAPVAMATTYTSLASSVYLHHPCGCGEEDGQCDDSTFTPEEDKYYTIQHYVDEDHYWTYQSGDSSRLINPGGKVDITSNYTATETHSSSASSPSRTRSVGMQRPGRLRGQCWRSGSCCPGFPSIE